MELSPGNSLAVLTLTGSRAKKLLRRHTTKLLHGRAHLCIPGKSKRLVPLQNSINYLGCCVGYKHFVADTVRKRMEAANNAFHRLKTVLCCRTVSLDMRIRLWKACVLSTGLHGLALLPMAQAQVLHTGAQNLC